MMQKTVTVVILALSLAHAASVEKRDTSISRDGAHGGSHGGAHGGSHGVSQGISQGAAPIASPGQSYESAGSQGNLYYYYYPVDAQETSVDYEEADIFTAIILPLLILGGVLLGLSSLSFTIGTGRRALDDDDVMSQVTEEIDLAFNKYLKAFQNEKCIGKAICQAGLHFSKYKAKNFFLDVIEPQVPEGMEQNFKLFKAAANSGPKGNCHKFKCEKPKW